MSADPFEIWWLDRLEEGVLLSEGNSWPDKFNRDELHNDASLRFKQYGLGSCSPKLFKTKLLEFLGVKSFSDLGSTRPREGGSRGKRYYYLPELAVCRKVYDQRTGHTTTWDKEVPGATEAFS